MKPQLGSSEYYGDRQEAVEQEEVDRLQNGVRLKLYFSKLPNVLPPIELL